MAEKEVADAAAGKGLELQETSHPDDNEVSGTDEENQSADAAKDIEADKEGSEAEFNQFMVEAGK